METQISCQVGERNLTIASGQLAQQANGAVTVSYEGTVVLVTVVAEKNVREGIDFLPLTVDYREKTSAAGKIPGGFFKREGRPTEKEILTARLIDRPIRPLFPQGLRNDIQVVAWVLSADGQNDPDILCINGASAALMVSGIPFAGPIGAVRVGVIGDQFVINPTLAQMEKSKLNLVLVGTKTALITVEGWADVVNEELILQAIRAGHQALGGITDAQEELRQEVAPEPIEFNLQLPPEDVVRKMEESISPELSRSLVIEKKKERGRALADLKEKSREKFRTENPDTEEWVFDAAFEAGVKKYTREMILKEGKRSDGRTPDEIRPISCQVGVFPRTHGSAIFSRGETQALVLTTLGTKSDKQRIDGLEEEEKKKRFMLHYNFPPFCTGEVAPMRGPKRREIGHGVLAERSLMPLLPPEDEFPYTIRVVSDILSSNGSSSMASVCGGSLSLMDAGVPVKSAVAGIAMGLLKEGEQTVILTDILGSEDALGDMDFKVAGTREGVTGLQMDIKVSGISEELMKLALEKARQARIKVLEKMDVVQNQPRPDISQYAPKILSLQIDPDKIGLVIGPKGKNVKALEKTGVTVEIEDDGCITISSADLGAAQRAKETIEKMVEEVEVGSIYRGTVKTVKEFGAFVEILPGKDGLVHISELADYRVRRVEDVLKEGDETTVKVIAIDNLGRIKLSRKQALAESSGGSTGKPV